VTKDDVLQALHRLMQPHLVSEGEDVTYEGYGYFYWPGDRTLDIANAVTPEDPQQRHLRVTAAGNLMVVRALIRGFGKRAQQDYFLHPTGIYRDTGPSSMGILPGSPLNTRGTECGIRYRTRTVNEAMVAQQLYNLIRTCGLAFLANLPGGGSACPQCEHQLVCLTRPWR